MLGGHLPFLEVVGQLKAHKTAQSACKTKALDN